MSYRKHKVEGVMSRHLKHGGQGFFLPIFTILFCVFLSLNVSAQNSSSARRDTSAKPLILLDGKVYSGDIKNLEPTDIMDITVLKGDNATNKYGKDAAAGAIEIRTKNYAEVHTPLLDSVANKSIIYIVDGNKTEKEKAGDINPNDILSIDVLKAAKNSISNEPVYDRIIITTKAFAIQQYQKKLSAFSKEYRSYFEHPQNNDSDFLYLIDGVAVDEKEKITKLYGIPSESIKEVVFKDKSSNLNNIKPIVVITTKK